MPAPELHIPASDFADLCREQDDREGDDLALLASALSGNGWKPPHPYPRELFDVDEL